MKNNRIFLTLLFLAMLATSYGADEVRIQPVSKFQEAKIRVNHVLRETKRKALHELKAAMDSFDRCSKLKCSKKDMLKIAGIVTTALIIVGVLTYGAGWVLNPYKAGKKVTFLDGNNVVSGTIESVDWIKREVRVKHDGNEFIKPLSEISLVTKKSQNLMHRQQLAVLKNTISIKVGDTVTFKDKKGVHIATVISNPSKGQVTVKITIFNNKDRIEEVNRTISLDSISHNYGHFDPAEELDD